MLVIDLGEGPVLARSAAGVLTPARDVTDPRREERVVDWWGSAEAAAERRDGGRDVVVEGAGGGEGSALGATEARWTLAARVVGAGVRSLLA
jgi:hypothetical protein